MNTQEGINCIEPIRKKKRPPRSPRNLVMSDTEFYDFPPFFTLQPVESTRTKQLQVWRRIILSWFSERPNENLLVLDSFNLFHNTKIDSK